MTTAAVPAIKLVDISIKKDKKNYIVEDVKRQEFYEMPELAVEALRLLQEGLDPGEIQAKLHSKYPAEAVNMEEFLEQLWELGLLHTWGEKIANVSPPGPSANRLVSHSWQTLGRILYHPVSVFVYALLFIGNLGQLIVEPLLMPNYTDMFISHSMIINIGVWAVLGLSAVFLHECGHSLAMAVHGLASRWQFSHRLFIPVIETDMTPLWSLPPKQRVVPLLAGMCVDLVLLFVFLTLQWIVPADSGVTPWLRMLSLQILLALGYQLLFFMKTDMYYIVQNDTGCYNLMENAQLWLKGRFFKQARQEISKEAYHGELPVIRAYSLLYVLGIGVSLYVLFTYLLPQMRRAIELTWPRLGTSPAEPLFWDAALFYLQLVVLLGWVTFSWLRSAASRRAQ